MRDRLGSHATRNLVLGVTSRCRQPVYDYDERGRSAIYLSLMREVAMSRWYERANEASFKLVPGGHLFQAPSPWIFARPSYYLVNDAQKKQLLASLARWRLLMLMAMAGMTSAGLAFMLMGTLSPRTLDSLFHPAYRLLGPGLSFLFCGIVLALLITSFIAAPQIYLARSLRPILATAPRSEQRIALREQTRVIAAAVSGKQLAIGLIAGLGMMSGAILQMIDAFFEGHLGRSAASSSAIVVAGGLVTGYFIYLRRLKPKAGRPG
jgi:hypothetical protein